MLKIKLYAVSLISLFLGADPSYACTAMGFPQGSDYVSAGNTDWSAGSTGIITVNKRGVLKTDVDLYDDGTLKLRWSSKYGSVATSIIGAEFPMNGINEAGLTIQLLQGEDTEFSASNGLPSLFINHVGQYLLDSAASVDEALNLLSKVRVYGRPKGTAHFFVCDQNYNCAVIEFLKGKMVAFKSNQLPISVITNNTYAKSVSQYFECLSLGCQLEPRTSLDRFVESAKLIGGKNGQSVSQKEAVSFFSEVAQIGPNNFTLWSVGFPSNFKSVRRLDIFSRKGERHQWIDFSKLDFSNRQPMQVQYLSFDQNGEKNSSFQNYSVEFQKRTTGEFYKNFLPQNMMDKLIAYPDTIKNCDTQLK